MPIDPSTFYNNSDHNDTAPDTAPERVEHSTHERQMFPKMVEAQQQRVQQQEARQGQQRQPTDQRPFAELTDGEKQARMFKDSPIYNDAAQETVNVLIESGQYTPEEAAEIFVSDYEPLARELELNATQTKAAAEVILGAWKTPVTAVLVESWTEQALHNVKAEWGTANAASVLRDARQLVASMPQLHAYLEENNLGSHPVLVKLLCERARAMRQAGKLR